MDDPSFTDVLCAGALWEPHLELLPGVDDCGEVDLEHRMHAVAGTHR